jgi:hypothetical protein
VRRRACLSQAVSVAAEVNAVAVVDAECWPAVCGAFPLSRSWPHDAPLLFTPRRKHTRARWAARSGSAAAAAMRECRRGTAALACCCTREMRGALWQRWPPGHALEDAACRCRSGASRLLPPRRPRASALCPSVVARAPTGLRAARARFALQRCCCAAAASIVVTSPRKSHRFFCICAASGHGRCTQHTHGARLFCTHRPRCYARRRAAPRARDAVPARLRMCLLPKLIVIELPAIVTISSRVRAFPSELCCACRGSSASVCGGERAGGAASGARAATWVLCAVQCVCACVAVCTSLRQFIAQFNGSSLFRGSLPSLRTPSACARNSTSALQCCLLIVTVLAASVMAVNVVQPRRRRCCCHQQRRRRLQASHTRACARVSSARAGRPRRSRRRHCRRRSA